MNDGPWVKIDFAVLKLRCLHRLPTLLSVWLPDGKRVGSEWVAKNPTRVDRKAGSFRINMISGLWADFATGDTGGDAISLFAYLNGLSQIVAARQLVELLGGAF